MLDEPVLPDIYEAELGIPEIRPIIIEMPTEPTQTTVANPIVCWFPALYDWVEVTWTPPGQKWQKERIELSGHLRYMLVHYDNPSEDLRPSAHARHLRPSAHARLKRCESVAFFVVINT